MMKKILSFVVTFLVAAPLASAATFSDVPNDHQYYAAIESLKNLKIISGYPDGTFHPDDPVNRAEALKMILNSAKIDSPSDFSDTGFPDVSNDAWFARFVVKAKSVGIVAGNPDGTFAPGRQVNKAEYLKMLLESFNTDLSHHQNLTSGVSADTSPDQWFLPYMSYAKTVGIIFPDTSNMLFPDKALTRGECAEIIYRLLIVENGGDVQKMLNIAESSLVSVVVYLGNNDIGNALVFANSAVFYTEQALALSSEGIVVAANKIALGFQKLTLAYQAGLEGRLDDVVSLVNEANALAGEAYSADSSTQGLGKEIKQQGQVLLDQTKL